MARGGSEVEELIVREQIQSECGVLSPLGTLDEGAVQRRSPQVSHCVWEAVFLAVIINASSTV